jgi:hypothetical protein
LGNWVGEVAEFPSEHLTTTALINYFADEFAFSPDETVAIMGAHTLGTLSNARSGFSGAWVHGERVFDNEFYQFLVDDNNAASTSYVQDNTLNANLEYTWVHQSPNGGGGGGGGRPEIMSNSDLALVYDFGTTTIDEDGKVSCTLSNTDGTTTAPLCTSGAAATMLDKVVEYSQDNLQWTIDFRAAFTKMLLKGHDTSHCITGELCDVSF